MLKHCILHIGTEKTGTTTIQDFLMVNRQSLLERGFLFPKAPGLSNQIRLVAFAQDDDTRDEIRRQLKIHSQPDLESFRKVFSEQFAAELKACPQDLTMVLSSELCHSRLRKEQELERLRQLLAEFCEHIKILVYFRRQDQTAVGHYSTSVRCGNTQRKVFPGCHQSLPYYYDYLTIVQNYRKVFGAENVIARIFERDKFVDGDLLMDFASAVGIGELRSFKIPENKNESILPEALEFIRVLNTNMTMFVGDEVNVFRQELVQLIAEEFKGKAQLVSRQEARDFYQHFKAGNEKLRQLCFPEYDSPLFSEDFEDYPAQVADSGYTFADAVKIATSIWQALAAGQSEQVKKLENRTHSQQQDIKRLRAKLHLSDGRHALNAGNLDIAQEHAEYSLDLAGNSIPDAYLFLAEVFERQQRIVEGIAAARQAVTLRPNHVGYLFRLGCLLQNNQEPDEAKHLMQRVLSENPNHAGALHRLQELEADRAGRP